MGEVQENTLTTPQSMYDSEGKIQEPKKAEELAYLEKPAHDREAELKRQEETGLTREQENNTAIMEGIKEKYPKAFEEVIDDKGRKILMLDIWGRPGQRLGVGKLLISQEGIIGINKDVPYLQSQEINTAGMIDAVAQRGAEFGKLWNGWESFGSSEVLISEKSREEWRISICKIDLLSAGDRENLKEAFIQSQESNISREQDRKKKEESMNPQKILADL